MSRTHEPAAAARLLRRLAKSSRRARPSRHKCRWSTFEVRTLSRHWGALAPRLLRARLPGRTWLGIYRQAQSLGLPTGIPQGWVSLCRAAKRLGYSHASVVRALAARARVAVRTNPCRRWCLRADRHYVEWDAILRAAERENRDLEVIGPAATRRGIATGRLWQWCHDADLLPPVPEGRRRRSPVRLPSAVIDRLVAKRLGRAA